MLMLSAISEFFIKFWVTMNSLLYHVATLLFEVFLNLASFKLIDTSRYQHIIQNFYVVLGVVMLFILAFSILKAMVNPDDKEQGTSVVAKIVKNLVISALILAVLPTLFTFAFDMQNALIHQNTLGQLLDFGGSGDGLVSETDDTSIGTEANKISNAIFTAFLYPADFNDQEATVKNPKKIGKYCDENRNNSVCIAIIDNDNTVNYAQAKTLVDQTKQYGLYKDFSGLIDDDVMDFNYILSLFGGLFLLYVIISFCFDLGIRLVKLIFYQIIAPIPVFLRVVPNGKLSGVFDNWVKVILTVYLEVFIRLLVVYFVVFICREVNSAMGQTNFGTGLLGLLTKAFIYMGLIAFMKQAPAAIAEVTGLESGNMKLGIKDKLAAGGAFAVGAVAGGAITAGARNLVSGVRDIKKANKEAKEEGKTGFARARMIASATRRAVGSTIAGTASAGLRAGYKGVTGGVNSTQDMVSTATSTARTATDKHNTRENYRSTHGGHILPHKDKTTGEWTGTMAGHFQDTVQRGKEWAGVEMDYTALQAERSASDEMLSSLNNIKATSSDYIEKHQQEFYWGLKANELNQIESLRRQLKEAEDNGDDTADILKGIEDFDKAHGHQRLDVLGKQADAIRARGKKKVGERFVGTAEKKKELDYAVEQIKKAKTDEERINAQQQYESLKYHYRDSFVDVMQTDEEFALEISNAENNYKKATKDITDGFASLSSKHVGAEKEAEAIKSEFNIINDKLKEKANSMVAKTFREGDDKNLVTPTAGNIDSDNATSFLKQLKNAAEVTNSTINREYEKKQRRDSSRDKK